MSALILFGWIQFSGPFLADTDPYYHIAVSKMYSREGILLSFPWMQCGVQKENYGDLHFLFHMAMVPFLWKDPILGGKAYAVVLASACVLVIALILRSFRVPFVPFWLLLLVGSGAFFLYRFSVVRPQILSVTFAILIFWAILREKPILLAPLTFLYFLSYSSAHLAVVLALIHSGVKLIVERKIVLRPVLAAAGGLLAGMLAHPHFPAILNVWLVQFQVLFHSLAGTPGLNLGGELQPATTDIFIKQFPLLLAVVLALLFWCLVKGWKLRTHVLSTFCTSVAFLGLTCLSKRFIEYCAPFLVLFSALAYEDIRRERPTTPRWEKAAIGAAYLLALIFAVKTTLDTRSVIASAGSSKIKPAAQWLAGNAEKGTVFHCDWDDFAELFFYNPKNYYLVGLDPTFFLARDPRLFKIWNEIRSGIRLNISQELRTEFKARYFFACRGEFEKAIKNAEADPGLVKVYSDAQSVVFAVKGGP